jgi:hypothetical protein
MTDETASSRPLVSLFFLQPVKSQDSGKGINPCFETMGESLS